MLEGSILIELESSKPKKLEGSILIELESSIIGILEGSKISFRGAAGRGGLALLLGVGRGVGAISGVETIPAVMVNGTRAMVNGTRTMINGTRTMVNGTRALCTRNKKK